MRRRKKPGAKEKLLSYEDYLCREPEKYKSHWQDYFHEQKPIHVELGTGRGQFISTLAEMNPHIYYIGIEIKEEVLLKAVEKAEAKKLKNILFLWYDINKIHDIFDEEELSRIYINFCDPWPKKRWVKRRLTHRRFLQKYQSILIEEGEVHFKTDNEKLFEFSLNEFSYENFRLNNITFDLHHSETNDGITTEYEDKFSAMGMKIYRCEGIKRN
ncbi:tRNA (guanosine(46)-N7)-methyltransferase TrmB [Clostridium formicaceticum]|uniref:tRNA (guanine-N(7)-)-methyltransferase n=1 Tax=Clostridium formicaceticum TaxID=1497 RepID=A0AAC9RN33_9CLOT|nr:tRNA (guanosine(46)-N7)-methyltransferase TrmB [Clostridium formicaceticum]AOY77985.1 tRNA (guanosine(46)-N7)-methyltransferase TrmB [Clostridium formicaceticum]ARE88612.1 tRNA (guanine-N(7)-)-methyltransferase [Clostridium formicaceticum]